MSEDRERAIVRATLDGDRKAAAEFVLTWRGTVRGLCRYHCGAGADADDLCQDVFERLLARGGARLRTWDGRASLRTWLAAVTRNLFLDRVRRRSPCRAEPLDDAFDLPDEGPTPEEGVWVGQLRSAVRASLAALSDRDRALLEMRYLDDLAAEQIASRLNMRAGTVRVALHRARERLASRLPPDTVGAHGGPDGGLRH